MTNNMKHILYTLIAVFLLVSCQQEDALLPTEAGKGYLSLSSIELQAETIKQIATRAVPSDLAIEILKADGTSVVKYDAGAAEASEKIELEAGNYKLKAYSPNFGTPQNSNEKGTPVYYKEQDFSIEAEKINYLAIQVPMINIGVQLILPETFSNWFDSYTFTVQLGDRNVILQKDEIAYFDLPAQSATLLYTLTATNKDDESQSKTSSYNDNLTGGVVYVITYSLSTNSFKHSLEQSEINIR